MIVLASQSPRRRELLSLITDDFKVVVSGEDEITDIMEPKDRVMHLARKKARAVFAHRPDDIVIGADTVVFARGEILEKPVDIADAERMMRLLSGSVHSVYTGLCVVYPGGELVEHCATEVAFCEIAEAELQRYLKTEQLLDKAGAYAIQGGAAKFIRSVKGCFFNVVGLPLNVLYGMLKAVDGSKIL